MKLIREEIESVKFLVETTKSGKKSSETGERYLPSAAIKALTPAEYAATTRAKREGKRQGKQFVAQPKLIMAKTRKYRT